MLLKTNEGKEACHKARNNADQLGATQKLISQYRQDLGLEILSTEDASTASSSPSPSQAAMELRAE
jgi:hypothetical protein